MITVQSIVRNVREKSRKNNRELGQPGIEQTVRNLNELTANLNFSQKIEKASSPATVEISMVLATFKNILCFLLMVQKERFVITLYVKDVKLMARKHIKRPGITGQYELIHGTAAKSGFRLQDCKEVIRGIQAAIVDGLREDGEVKIVDFGKWYTYPMCERNNYNAVSGEYETLPARVCVGWHAGVGLKDHVNRFWLGPDLSEKKEEKSTREILDEMEAVQKAEEEAKAEALAERKEQAEIVRGILRGDEPLEDELAEDETEASPESEDTLD